MTAFPRRTALAGLSSLAATAALARTPADAFAASPRPSGDPFTLGIASGDPTPHTVVLWTRLAPDPLAANGGMPDRPVGVEWQLAHDEGFRQIARSGTAWAVPQLAHSVHIDPPDLGPGREFFYRFRYAGHISPVGRTRTLPARGWNMSKLRLAFASCQAWSDGYYAALRHLATEDADLTVHLGDYVYEGGIPGDAGLREAQVPEVMQQAPQDLTRWRQQYAWYKSDPDLQAAHRANPWLVTWDDHEVVNDYANTHSQSPPYEIARLRRAAYQAWYEHQPVRLTTRQFASPTIYRRIEWGRLAQFDLIDGRQYRDIPPCGWGEAQACAQAYDPAISMLGRTQEEWLYAGLRRSRARWNLLGSNVMLARLDHDGAKGDLLWNDAWDGFPAARLRLIDAWRRAQTRNPVVFTGDWHSTFVNDIHANFDKPGTPVVATEFVGTSLTTNGDGQVYGPYYGPMIKYNPHIQFFDGDRRGYQVATVTEDELRVDLRMVRTVSTRFARKYTLASFRVRDGIPGAERI